MKPAEISGSSAGCPRVRRHLNVRPLRNSRLRCGPLSVAPVGDRQFRRAAPHLRPLVPAGDGLANRAHREAHPEHSRGACSRTAAQVAAQIREGAPVGTVSAVRSVPPGPPRRSRDGPACLRSITEAAHPAIRDRAASPALCRSRPRLCSNDRRLRPATTALRKAAAGVEAAAVIQAADMAADTAENRRKTAKNHAMLRWCCSTGSTPCGGCSSVGSSARLWFWMSRVQIPPAAPNQRKDRLRIFNDLLKRIPGRRGLSPAAPA